VLNKQTYYKCFLVITIFNKIRYAYKQEYSKCSKRDGGSRMDDGAVDDNR